MRHYCAGEKRSLVRVEKQIMGPLYLEARERVIIRS